MLCITETHLSQLDVPPAFQIEGYDMFSHSRWASYRHYADVAKKDGGGVSIYCKTHLQVEALTQLTDVSDLELVAPKLQAPIQALIAAVYRPPSYSLGGL